MKTARTVCVITGARSEYGLLKPVMEEMRRSQLELRFIVAGMHLCHEFGNTYKQIERDGFQIAGRVDMTLSGDNNAAMTKSIGIGVYGLAQALEGINPDIVLVLGDRVEAFAGAISAAGLNKVVAHIHGGEKTRGGLDESMRHAITKLAHIHLVATEKDRQRVIRMGESPKRVFRVGAPGLDTILNSRLYGRRSLERRLGFQIKRPLLLAVQHSVSTDADSAAKQMVETLEALKAMGYETVLIYPNSDAGGRRVLEVIDAYRSEAWLHVVPSLEHTTYLSLLKRTDLLVGNSSSGIIEAPSFHKPVVNIGSRQEGRDRSTNVIDVPHRREDIRKAIHRAFTHEFFRAQVRTCRNPYGDGKASKRIVKILRTIRVTPDLLQKQLAYA